MRDSVWAVQNDQYRDIFVANETLLWAETRLNGGLEGGGHAGAAQRLRRGVYFWILTYVTW